MVNKFNDITFISPSNISPEFESNIISVGISLESQLQALSNFIKKQNKDKTVIMYPDNHYKSLSVVRSSVKSYTNYVFGGSL